MRVQVLSANIKECSVNREPAFKRVQSVRV